MSATDKHLEAVASVTPDMVNHPPHYNSGPVHTLCGESIECIDVIEDRPANIANAMKYLWRAGLKGDAVEDLQKAIWYVNREVERMQRRG